MERHESTASPERSPQGPDEANDRPSLAVIGRALLDLLHESTGRPIHLVPASRPVLGERRGIRVKLLHVAEDPTLRNVVPRPGESRSEVAASPPVLTYAISVTVSDEDLERGALAEHDLLGRVISVLQARPIVEVNPPSGPLSIRFLLRLSPFDDASQRAVVSGDVMPPLVFVDARFNATGRAE